MRHEFRRPDTRAIAIDGDRLWRELDELAQFSAVLAPAVTRIVFSDAISARREYAGRRCAARRSSKSAVTPSSATPSPAGLEPTHAASRSHRDRTSTRFQMPADSMEPSAYSGPSRPFRALRRSGLRPRRSLELILFTSEEPTRFGVGCLGSRLMFLRPRSRCGGRPQRP